MSPVSQTALAVQMNALESALDGELAALAGGRFDLLDDFTRRKARALLWLAKRAPDDADAGIAPRLRALRAHLDVNARELLLHLSAISEIAEALAAAVAESEWDGTYQPVPAAT